jgi:hypothetical protein
LCVFTDRRKDIFYACCLIDGVEFHTSIIHFSNCDPMFISNDSFEPNGVVEARVKKRWPLPISDNDCKNCDYKFICWTKLADD